MHSNGGRCLAPEAKSPVVGESRRAGAIAGATGEKLRTALVMRHFALRCSFATVASCRWRLGQSGRSETTVAGIEPLRRLNTCVPKI